MEIIMAKNSGFCFGVEKSISTALKVIDKNDSVVYSLGPLIHNNQAVDFLKKKGLYTISDINDIRDSKIIIRSHGVPLKTYSEAEKNNNRLIDSTCPFVRKIQEKAKDFYNRGYKIFIIGNPNHPEVIGINGWCENSAHVIEKEDDVEVVPNYDKICIVAQTTITNEKFEKVKERILEKGKEVKVFNTICNATKLRQESCAEVAKQVDAMIIVGGYHSSNTQKLVEISSKYCSNIYHIETANDLNYNTIKKYKRVGITAGASTPDWIIKEVVNKMNINQENNMNEMMKAIENSMVTIQRGDIVKGTVISVNENEVMVNIGYKSDGVIKKDELSNDPTIDPRDIVKVGDEIEVFVIKLDDNDGNVVLSKKSVDSIKGWEELEEAFNDAKVIDAKVIEVVKGGAIAVVNGIRGFIPASHISTRYVDDLSSYLGKEFKVQIIDFDQKRNKIVLSRKKVEKEENEKKKNKLWNTIESGQRITGTVKRITDFGAFVDIGGIDGLIHISELSWGRVNHPSEVVKEGDEVEVIVLDFDKDKERISLGLKQNIPHPWESISNKYNVGDVVEGTVTKLVNFGAFIELEPGIEGLVHISQISNDHISKASDVISQGEKVIVKILDVKEDEQRISLSIKDTIEEKDNDPKEFNDDTEITVGDIVKNK